MNKNIKYLGISTSTRKDKRYMAKFQIDGGIKYVHFGSPLYENYTMHKDEERKKRYKIRHKHDNLTDPLSPGALSMYILWSKPTLEEGEKFYKKHFKI
jgi:hypothetical protein